MARRAEFPYGAPQPNMGDPSQQHHGTAVPPPMGVQQQPPSGPPSQQQTPTPAHAQPNNRQRKRPAPGATPVGANSVVVPPPVSAPGVAATQAIVPPTVPSAMPVPGDEAAPAPPAKKSRTNTPWTPQEELRLKQMRDAGNSWAEIAKTFPARTEGSVKKHWYKDMHYAEFAEDESQALLTAIKEYENNKWKVIGQKVGKPAKACEQYAKEHFPDLFTHGKGR